MTARTMAPMRRDAQQRANVRGHDNTLGNTRQGSDRSELDKQSDPSKATARPGHPLQVVAFLHQPQDNHYVLLALEAVAWLKADAINAFGEPRLPAGRGGLPGLPHGLPVNSFSELVERAVLKNETKRQLNKHISLVSKCTHTRITQNGQSSVCRSWGRWAATKSSVRAMGQFWAATKKPQKIPYDFLARQWARLETTSRTHATMQAAWREGTRRAHGRAGRGRAVAEGWAGG